MEEAIELFSTRGYAATSMRDIAKAVGINVASIYHHFDCKQALLDAIILEAEARMLSMMPNPEVIVRAAMERPMEELLPVIWAEPLTALDCKMLRLILMIQYEDQRVAALVARVLGVMPRRIAETVIRALIEAGRVPPLDVEMVSALLASHLFDTFSRSLIGNAGADEMNRRGEDAVRTILRAMGSAPLLKCFSDGERREP